MTETKITPGPWTAAEGGGRWRVFSVELIDETQLPHLIANCWKGDAAEGDAHLIAAAPGLYEALEDITNSYKAYRRAHDDYDTSDSIETAEAALAKASGETS